MKQIKTLLIIGTAAAAFAVTPAINAQVSSVKDQAVEIVKVAAQDKTYGSGTKGKTERAKSYGSDKAEGEAAKVKSQATEKAKSYGSGTKDGAVEKVKSQTTDKTYGSGKAEGEAVKAKATDKTYGSGKAKGEAVKAKATDKAYGSSTKDGAVEKAKSYGSGNKGTVKTSAPPAQAPAISCPAGTTAQSNGTCMITGNYKVN